MARSRQDMAHFGAQKQLRQIISHSHPRRSIYKYSRVLWNIYHSNLPPRRAVPLLMV